MALPAFKYATPEEYLEMEKDALEKHEYFKGEVVAMAGASEAHARISRNLVGELHNYLKGKSCEVFGSDYRVTTPLFDSYMYPDAMIVCGPTQKKKDTFDTLTNPSVIIEILSPSTHQYDKAKKLLYYLQIPSLKEYIVVDTSKYSVATFRRTDDGTWDISTTEDIRASHTVNTIGLQLPLKDIYYMVSLEKQPGA
jgi:Uma2 family endonuclease